MPLYDITALYKKSCHRGECDPWTTWVVEAPSESDALLAWESMNEKYVSESGDVLVGEITVKFLNDPANPRRVRDESGRVGTVYCESPRNAEQQAWCGEDDPLRFGYAAVNFGARSNELIAWPVYKSLEVVR